jgi:hypothetical protein
MPHREYRWLSEWNNHLDEIRMTLHKAWKKTQAKEWKQADSPLLTAFLTPFATDA